MKRLMIVLGAAGALFGGAVVSAAPNASPSAAPASMISSGSTANTPAATTSTQAANPAVVANVPAAPPIPSNAQGCVGAIVSTATHGWQLSTHDGLGGAANDLGVNVGKSIQAAATTACGKH